MLLHLECSVSLLGGHHWALGILASSWFGTTRVSKALQLFGTTEFCANQQGRILVDICGLGQILAAALSRAKTRKKKQRTYEL